MVKKIQVSFSDKQAELLEKFKGELGDSDADIVRNIVIAWLAEKSFITSIAKQRLVEVHSNYQDMDKYAQNSNSR